MLGISDAAESLGFRTKGVKITWEQLRDDSFAVHAEVLDYDQMQCIVGGYATDPKDCPEERPACYCNHVFQGCLSIDLCLQACSIDPGTVK